MSDPKVTVRMYRVGLGDCHLLSFKADGGDTRHILIDCGYFPGSHFPGLTTDKIVDDIKAKTNNRLDAVVVTHEHQDHIQGFMDGEETFKKMKLGELWVAWTEKPGQKIVAESSIAALEKAANGLAASGGKEEKSLANTINDILGFSKGTDLAFEKIKGWFAEGARKYWNPGDIIEPAWLPGVRIYVLAPPKDINLLHKMTGKKNVEMYELTDEQSGFAAAALKETIGKAPEELSPFDGKYARKSLPESLADSYDQERWRRIDNDWLLSAARFALQLDTYTNNTSLVLAFELKESGRVLLFVGDAQIGNWLSWQSVKFKVENKEISAADLLARTVYYKVGHHGSHNATLVEGGLLAMTSAQLHAAIPTNQTWASKSKHWEMPNARLWDELQKRCVKPIFRADVKPQDPATVHELKPS